MSYQSFVPYLIWMQKAICTMNELINTSPLHKENFGQKGQNSRKHSKRHWYNCSCFTWMTQLSIKAPHLNWKHLIKLWQCASSSHLKFRYRYHYHTHWKFKQNWRSRSDTKTNDQNQYVVNQSINGWGEWQGHQNFSLYNSNVWL